MRRSTDISVVGVACSACMMIFGAITLVAITAAAKPGADTVAAVFPIWWSEKTTLLAAASAGTLIIRPGGLASIIVVKLPQDNGMKRLREAGAWISLDPLAIDACLGKSQILRDREL